MRYKMTARREAYKQKILEKRLATCMNCGQKGSHFVAPSMGENGYFTCQEWRKGAANGPA